jgi:hypothetical protein
MVGRGERGEGERCSCSISLAIKWKIEKILNHFGRVETHNSGEINFKREERKSFLLLFTLSLGAFHKFHTNCIKF